MKAYAKSTSFKREGKQKIRHLNPISSYQFFNFFIWVRLVILPKDSIYDEAQNPPGCIKPLNKGTRNDESDYWMLCKRQTL